MRRTTPLSSGFLALLIAVGAASAASAQQKPGAGAPAYTAQSVLEHFLGKPGDTARAVCIGECPKQEEAAQPAFDLEVTFDFNSDSLTVEARRNLDEFAKALKDPRLTKIRFSVDGHTDARGAEAYNLTLSDRRARAVTRYLADLGIESERLEPRAFGKSRPKVADPFDGANRRVEAKVLN
jgi:outer membrane protein OmpA-like peptidoglycan-associated protein